MKNKKKKNSQRRVVKEEEEEKQKKKERKNLANRDQWRRKIKKWSKIVADPDSGSLHVCLIIKILLKTKL